MHLIMTHNTLSYFLYFTACAAVLHTAGCHAAPEGTARAADTHDRGKHPEAAGGAASDSGGTAEGSGSGLTGERERAPSAGVHICVIHVFTSSWFISSSKIDSQINSHLFVL